MSDSQIAIAGFAEEPPELRAALVEACQRVIDSGTWVLGPEVEAFETEFAAFTDTAYCIGVGNGLDAIEIAMRARGIGPGDEVITSPMTAAASVIGIIRAGATPVLADIDPTTALLDPQSVERCISSRTRAVLLVHLYGQMRNMDAWVELCAEHDLVLLEDCAQSHGARWQGRHGGTFGLAGGYSFYPTKNLGAIGDAGAIVTNNVDIAERARVLRNYGQRARYEHIEVGLNSRLDEIQAAMLRSRLEWLPEFTGRRQHIAAMYREGITNPHIALLAEPGDPEQHVYHQFVVTTNDREAFISHLAANEVPALIHYPTALHQQPSFAGIAHDSQGLPHAEAHAASCVSLPCHPQLTDDQVEKVIRAVESYSG